MGVIPLQILPSIMSLEKRKEKLQGVRDRRAVFPLLSPPFALSAAPLGKFCLSAQDWVLEPGAGLTHSRSPPTPFRDGGAPRALGLW